MLGNTVERGGGGGAEWIRVVHLGLRLEWNGVWCCIGCYWGTGVSLVPSGSSGYFRETGWPNELLENTLATFGFIVWGGISQGHVGKQPERAKLKVLPFNYASVKRQRHYCKGGVGVEVICPQGRCFVLQIELPNQFQPENCLHLPFGWIYLCCGTLNPF